jgi:hypothetical protein
MHPDRTHPRVAALLILALGACGGDDPGLEVDAAPPDAPLSNCEVPPGRTFIISKMRIASPEESFDLDGDGEPDGEFGKMPAAAKSIAEDGLNDGIVAGNLTLLIHLAGLPEVPGPDAPDVVVMVFSGIDAETPPNPETNLTGKGEFFVGYDQFDVDCTPLSGSDQSGMADWEVSASRTAWEFPLYAGRGTLVFALARFEATLAPDYSGFTARFGGATTLCSLSATPFPGEIMGSVLDALVNDDALSSAMSVDMDLDDDGLEEVVGDGVSVLHCIDGDGVTVIPDKTCPCHPAIVDGYSITWKVEAVPAKIVGIR